MVEGKLLGVAFLFFLSIAALLLLAPTVADLIKAWERKRRGWH